MRSNLPMHLTRRCGARTNATSVATRRNGVFAMAQDNGRVDIAHC
jgi:hypothetical protein